MNKEIAIKNRSTLLRSRGTDNGKIIAKLERKLRQIQKSEVSV